MKEDKDLEFLAFCKNEDLQILVDYLTTDKDGKKRYWETLTKSNAYLQCYPDHLTSMWEDIANEFQLFGGNTIANCIRKTGVTYRTILFDVCNRMKVNYNKNASIEMIEEYLLQKILTDSLEQMTAEDMKKLVDEMNIKTQTPTKQGMTIALQMAIRNGGFAPYKMAVIVANAVAQTLLGRGLSLALNAGLTKYISVFAGPIGWLVTVLWTLVDVAGPANRVTKPSVIQIIYMRRRSQMLLE